MPSSSPRRSEQEATRQRVISAIIQAGERAVARALAHGEARQARILTHAVNEAVERNSLTRLRQLRQLRHWPVTLEEFVHSKEFLGGRVEVWPALYRDLLGMNPDVFVGEEPVHEVLLGGATSTGKTTVSAITNHYQLYLFTCFDAPQRLYGLAASTPIVFQFMSVSHTVTRRVIYSPFRSDFLSMPYVQQWVPYDRYKDSSLDLDGGLQVVPSLATVESIIGQAVPGGIIDEVNFMAIIEESKKVPGARGMGGRFDQAETIYWNIARRRKSRFTTRGLSLGTLCVLSSTRYRGDFLDRRMDEAQRNEERNIVCFRRAQYDVQPADRYSGERFGLLVGTDRYPTKVIEEGDQDVPQDGRVIQVPVEYIADFRRDPEGSLRDVCGIATDAITPWIAQRHKLIDAVIRGRDKGLKQIVDVADVDYAFHGLPQIVEENLPSPEDRAEHPRWVHIDLALSNDRCGLAMVKHTGWVQLVSAQQTIERLPTFDVELSMSIKPSTSRQLDIGDLRAWVMQLVSYWGFWVYAVTFDGFQSRDSMQILQRAGIRSYLVSVDRDLDAYEYMRRVYYQDRIDQVDHEMARLEFSTLELNQSRGKGKVDHPPKGSKDVADAITGAIYAASRSRYIRTGPEYRDQAGLRVRTIGAQDKSRDDGKGEPPRRRTDAFGNPILDDVIDEMRNRSQ